MEATAAKRGTTRTKVVDTTQVETRAEEAAPETSVASEAPVPTPEPTPAPSPTPAPAPMPEPTPTQPSAAVETPPLDPGAARIAELVEMTDFRHLRNCPETRMELINTTGPDPDGLPKPRKFEVVRCIECGAAVALAEGEVY